MRDTLQRALDLLQEGLRAVPDSPAFMTSVGVMLDSLDRPADALVYLRAAVTRAPGSAAFRRNLIPTLLRLAQPAEAMSLCAELACRPRMISS